MFTQRTSNKVRFRQLISSPFERSTTRRTGGERQIYADYELYDADVTVPGMLSDAYIFGMAVDDAADYTGEEEPPEVPTTGETINMLQLLLN